MRLKNKKTGEIVERVDISIRKVGVVFNNDETYDTLAELNEEWEDVPEESREYWYIEPDGSIIQNHKPTHINHLLDGLKSIDNYFDTLEEAELAVRKLKAWKRLKDKGFEFCKYSALAYGEIEFRIPDFEGWNEEENEQIKADLDLLFGGEE